MKRDDDPERLLSSSSTEDAALRTLLQAGRDELPRPAQLAELAARLGPILDPPAGGGGGGHGSGSTGPGGASAGPGGAVGSSVVGATAAKAIALVAAGVIAGVAVWRLGKDHPAARTEAAAPSLLESSATPTQVSTSIPGPAVAPSSSTPAVPEPAQGIRVSASTHAAASAAILADDPDREVKLLQRAEDALSADPSQALSLCGEHARAFPRGLLAQEREVIAVDALVRLGRPLEARRRADQFAAAYPSSTHLRRVEALVGNKP